MIVTDTVNEQMYELIRNMILERKLKPGERVNPKELAESNNVSLMPVRNALQQLTYQGLLETRQRVGVFVKQYTNTELQQIGEVRKLYELYCLGEFGDRIGKDQILELYRQIEKTDADSRAMLLLDERLHKMIVEASENPFLIQQYDSMQNLIRIHMYSENDQASESKKAHMDLLAALYQENYASAYSILERHLNVVTGIYEECTT